MKIMLSFWKVLWKTAVVAGSLVLGSIATNQAGWSGAELIVNWPHGGVGDFITDLFFSVGAAIAVGTVLLVRRVARPVLWVMVPIFLYFAVVLGAWNGVASDFDAICAEALKYHSANAYALEHMSQRGRFLSCQDQRIELTEDAKAVCALALNVGPGERIPGANIGADHLQCSVALTRPRRIRTQTADDFASQGVHPATCHGRRFSVP